MLNRYYRNRLLLLLAVIVCFTLFWWAGRMFDIPAHAGHSISLLQQPAPAAAFFVTAVVLAACVLLGTLIAGTVRFDAGLFAGAVGLAALSIRGGPARHVLLGADGPWIYIVLTVELLLLYAIVGLAWAGLWLLHLRGWLAKDEFRDGVEDVEHQLDQKALALLTQAAVMALAMLLLARSDQKMQALAAVGIASLLGTMASHYLFPIRPSVWFWCGPLVVGCMGYLLAYSGPGAWHIGQINQPLARPLPLDYAAMGPAGSLIGYWMSRRWQADREAGAEAVRA